MARTPQSYGRRGYGIGQVQCWVVITGGPETLPRTRCGLDVVVMAIAAGARPDRRPGSPLPFPCKRRARSRCRPWLLLIASGPVRTPGWHSADATPAAEVSRRLRRRAGGGHGEGGAGRERGQRPQAAGHPRQNAAGPPLPRATPTEPTNARLRLGTAQARQGWGAGPEHAQTQRRANAEQSTRTRNADSG